ncbi:MAG: hypothetical protein CK425_11035 [Parachlamydia sp.]|nr:MAG: hypothetical protein CK425_11035 [Parachlamydia sp.]
MCFNVPNFFAEFFSFKRYAMLLKNRYKSYFCKVLRIDKMFTIVFLQFYIESYEQVKNKRKLSEDCKL